MKKFLIILIVITTYSYSQEPTIRFYLDDGSVTNYKISDIACLFVSGDNPYVMQIYHNRTKIAYYPNEVIQSIKIETVSGQGLFLNVNIYGYPWSYPLIDIDSITFKTDKWQPLTIGDQVWMLKNLDVEKYRNGDSIIKSTNPEEWYLAYSQNKGAFTSYHNSDSLKAIYGLLYNWYAVNDPRGLAPDGWHVASDKEWSKLYNYLFKSFYPVPAIRETGTAHWLEPNDNATNTSGFTALPAGRISLTGKYYELGNAAYWWTSVEADAQNAWRYHILRLSKELYKDGNSKSSGISVRCIKD